MTDERLLAVLEPNVADRRQTEGAGGNVPGVTTEAQCPGCGANQTDHEGRCWWCNKRYRYPKVTP